MDPISARSEFQPHDPSIGCGLQRHLCDLPALFTGGVEMDQRLHCKYGDVSVNGATVQHHKADIKLRQEYSCVEPKSLLVQP